MSVQFLIDGRLIKFNSEIAASHVRAHIANLRAQLDALDGDQPGHPFRGNQHSGGEGGSVEEHAARLTAALESETKFASAFAMLHGLPTEQLKSLAREFTKVRAGSRKEALANILQRHTSLMGAGRRNLLTSQRTAG